MLYIGKQTNTTRAIEKHITVSELECQPSICCSVLVINLYLLCFV